MSSPRYVFPKAGSRHRRSWPRHGAHLTAKTCLLYTSFLGASSLTVAQVWTTIAAFTLLYSALAFIEVRLMLASIRKGPEPRRAAAGATNEAKSGAGYTPLPAE